jgi:subtilisin family serine protease
MTYGGTMTYGGGARLQYAVPGWGGRTPVAYLGSPPARSKDRPDRPVVAILDTGLARHPWLSDDVEVLGGAIGDEPEDTGVVHDPFQGPLDDFSGHGTFIAGLIRQTCPDAHIVMVKTMDADGFDEESTMINALLRLAREHRGQVRRLDGVSMSFGYYHEEPGDRATDSLLLRPIRDLAANGVLLVASAGNDATSRPMHPAAFAPDVEQLVSVGARNPNGTVALFSNCGSWVKVYWPGAQVFSTMPPSFNASAQPTARVADGHDSPARETLDVDDFSAGFALWSGTSFAAPAFLGRCLQRRLDHPGEDRSTGVEHVIRESHR